MLKALAVALAVTVAATMATSGRATESEKAARSVQTSRTILVQSAPAPTSTTTVARAVKVVISGKVQGVGYRDWAVRRAKALRIRGWVENAPNGTVHALFGGSDAAVTEMLVECREGPRRARVRDVTVESVGVDDLPSDFSRRN